MATKLERSLGETLEAIQAQRSSQILNVTPRLAADRNKKQFQVVLDVKSPVPFQADYLITEPSGNVLSSLMMGPTRIDPKDRRRIRFPAVTLKPLTPGNDVYVLSGKVGHIPSEQRPVPQLHRFEVRYRSLNQALLEVSRQQPPPH